MKRDLDLVRSILLRCEESEGETLQAQDFALDVEQWKLAEHVEIMMEDDLLDGEMIKCMGGEEDDFFIRKITWHGHDFLEQARDTTVWHQFLKTAKERAMSMTVGFAIAWLKQQAKGRFGIEVP